MCARARESRCLGDRANRLVHGQRAAVRRWVANVPGHSSISITHTLSSDLLKPREHKNAAKDCFEAAGGAVNIQQLLGGYETIPEGTVLKHRMHGRELSKTELAFLFLGLRKLAREGRLGAHAAHGCGYFTAEYDVQFAPDGDTDLVQAGKLHMANHRLALDSDVAELREAFERSETILNDMSAFRFKRHHV